MVADARIGHLQADRVPGVLDRRREEVLLDADQRNRSLDYHGTVFPSRLRKARPGLPLWPSSTSTIRARFPQRQMARRGPPSRVRIHPGRHQHQRARIVGMRAA